MSDKQKAIFAKIAELRDKLEDFRCELNVLRDAYDVLGCERDAAVQRAEAAEKKLNDPDYRYAGKGPIHRNAILIRNKHIDEARQERDAAIERAEKAELTLAVIAERCRMSIAAGEFSGHRVEATIRAIHIVAKQESSEEKEVANALL